MAKGKGQGSIATQFKKGMQPRGRPFLKGQVAWNKGLKGVYHFSPEVVEKMRLSHIGIPHPGRRRRILKICERCGKEFETGGRAGKRNQVYCSIQCARLRRNGRTMHPMGYVQIRQNGRYILEHRLIAEQMLGRPLKKTEIVHHNNGDKLDNRKENLTVMSQACHRVLIDYLASLWIKEHPDMVDKVTREFEITFSSGG